MKKRMMAVMMAATVACSALAGCSSGTSGSTAKAASGEQRTVADIQEYGKLKVGAKSDTVNIGIIDTATGEYEGYDIDVAYEMAAKIFDCTYDEAVEKKLVEFTSVTAKTRGGLLDNGELDCVIASFTTTEERKKSWNFTQPYRLEPVTFMVSKASGAETLADMDGFIIGVGQGTTTAELIGQYAKDKGIEINYEVQDFQYISDGVAALKTGQIDAYSVDRTGLLSYMDDTMMLTEDAFGVQDIGIALKLGNDELTKYMDDTLTELKESGRLDELKKKWGILTDEEVKAME
ncbi:MAG: transporter substrate-binding domain-containing protein [Eubacteriales bacterium]|nr:transporter substrate-binding domain-containing protein [Eubacteriales bacterium]